MKKIRVQFVDCDFLKKNFLPFLNERYEVVETEEPDFAFFNDESKKDCVFHDCVRILFLGENNRPDFNLFDYAVGFDDIVFGDRYLQAPLYTWPTYRHPFLELALEKEKRDIREKTEFCAFLVSNGNTASTFREKFYDRLSNYKRINSGGLFRNNMPDGKTVPREEMLEFYAKHKFVMAFENSKYPSYTTEKIIRAWAGGAVPIYWGDPKVSEVFNPEAFIEVEGMDEQSVDKAIERIIQLDQNDELYQEMLLQPIIKDNVKAPSYMNENTIRDFLYHIFDQTPEQASRRTNSKDGWGAYYEKDMLRYITMDRSSLNHLIYRKIKKL